MRRALSLLFIILSLLTFKKFAYAQPEVDACFNFLDARDYKRAIEAGKKAIEKYPNDLYAHFCLGTSYFAVGDPNLALEHMKKAESLTSNKEILMYIYNQIGAIYRRMEHFDDALLYYSRSLNLARDLRNRKMIASALMNIGSVYGEKGELDKALSFYKISLELQTELIEKASTYSNIASIYKHKGDYKKAVEYLQKAIKIYEMYGEYHGVSIIKLNLGNAYRKMKDYKKAKKYIL